MKVADVFKKIKEIKARRSEYWQAPGAELDELEKFIKANTGVSKEHKKQYNQMYYQKNKEKALKAYRQKVRREKAQKRAAAKALLGANHAIKS